MQDSTANNKIPVIALAGNPNAGKTTLFNGLTGMRQRTANFSGVTVERKEGAWKFDGKNVRLVDLPGLYSLDATSIDEQIAREILTGESSDLAKPDVIIAVVDATNIERNLYLVTQILAYHIPVVIALTMVDLAEKEGLRIDHSKLAAKLGVPVIPVKVSQKIGLNKLAQSVGQLLESGRQQEPKWLERIGRKDADVHLSLSDDDDGNRQIFARYAFIADVYQESVGYQDASQVKFSEKVDRILTHKFFGLVILVAVLLLIFNAIFSWAEVPMDLLDRGVGATADWVGNNLPDGVFRDIVVDGIIAGVGGVLVFLPQILLLFLFISILEDTGYMARAAFLLDKLMSRVGLHGKAFLPLMSSFACAIPGIMATRTIENRRDRIATIMIAPFMSCSARLPVYALMIAAFFSGEKVLGVISLGAVLMLAMYALGIIVALVIAFALKKTVLKSPRPPFLMELPPYRFPDPRTVLQNMFTQAWLFVRRAGTVILAFSIILWALMYFPRYVPPSGATNIENLRSSKQVEQSYAGMLGKTIEPAIAPLGFDWHIGIALVSSFAAREVLVSTLSIIYNVGGDADENSPSLLKAIHDAKTDSGKPVWRPLTALTMMVFFALAMQCISTLAIVRRETNSWRWMIFMFVYMSAIAYFAAFLTFQVGKLLGF